MNYFAVILGIKCCQTVVKIKVHMIQFMGRIYRPSFLPIQSRPVIDNQHAH